MWSSIALLFAVSSTLAAAAPPEIPPLGFFPGPAPSVQRRNVRPRQSSGTNVTTTSWGATCTDFFFDVSLEKDTPYDLSMENYNITILHEIAERRVLKSGTYEISGRWCVPAKQHQQARLKDTISVLVHGATFNKLMWDFPFQNEKFSYVKQANEAGYTTFAFDLIGAGNSTIVDGYLEAQAASYVELTHNILQRLRKTSDFGGKRWKKIIITGFSIGGTISNAIADKYPSDLDAIVLHGVSWGLSWVYPAFIAGLQASAALVDANRWGGYHNFYQAHVSPQARIAACFHGNYTEEMAAADYELRDLDTIGAAISFTYHLVTAPRYTGPVFLGIGDYDSTFCDGINCRTSGAPWELYKRFPRAKAHEIKVYDGAGHAVILHENGREIIKDSIDFLKKNGF